ncbi:hypothetical protein [Streptomyces sp. NBC_00203]|uniref:hypothetical protein n=1 Tax=Streptomyces sp. NBC_00203 TaxID=2975680 RepID=UPI0032443A32
MSDPDGNEHLSSAQAGVPQPPEAAPEAAEDTTEQKLRVSHAARTRSAASRAAAICHYIGQHSSDETDEKHEGGTADERISWKSAHAARVAAQAVAVLAESSPAPAADSRCARNASASAAQAAQMGQLHDSSSELSVAACRAALKASQAAAAAAGAGGLGENETLNAKADAAEADAVATAEEAGWMLPGQDLPEVSTGIRSPDLMSMLHL